MTEHYYRWRTNTGNGRTTLELYRFHPEVGPPGTPGRGPYCLRWMPVLAKDRARTIEALEADPGWSPLPEGD